MSSYASGSDERVATMVGGYRIDALIGAGGMGTVYAATASDGARVALKIVREDYAQDVSFRSRFTREANIAKAVRNRHIVPVLDTGEHLGVPYMVQQFIDGRSLEQELAAQGRLDVATTVRISWEVAQGLQALWAAGMVHRDIKPGNILLDRARTAYVTDFGLAKRTKGTVLTMPGQAVGSVDYMSPEQVKGDEVTGASDVYALGCVVFECLQGRPPFADREGMAVLWAHLQDEPPDLDSPGADVSADFVRALKSALSKEPQDRPPSAIAYAAELARTASVGAPGPES